MRTDLLLHLGANYFFIHDTAKLRLEHGLEKELTSAKREYSIASKCRLTYKRVKVAKLQASRKESRKMIMILH